jgi:hypothetical protein
MREQDGVAHYTRLVTLVNFDFDLASLTQDARQKLTEFVKALKDNRLRAHNIVVEGNDGRAERLSPVTRDAGIEALGEQISETQLAREI